MEIFGGGGVVDEDGHVGALGRTTVELLAVELLAPTCGLGECPTGLVPQAVTRTPTNSNLSVTCIARMLRVLSTEMSYCPSLLLWSMTVLETAVNMVDAAVAGDQTMSWP